MVRIIALYSTGSTVPGTILVPLSDAQNDSSDNSTRQVPYISGIISVPFSGAMNLSSDIPVSQHGKPFVKVSSLVEV